MKLEDLQPNVVVRGILPDALATVVSVQWYGDNALEPTYKDPGGRVSNEAQLDRRHFSVYRPGRRRRFSIV